MNRLTHFVAAVVLLSGFNSLVAGPERIETKDYKAAPEPAPIPVPCKWTGFYIGVHGGYSWGDQSFLEQDESDPAYEFNQDGFFGGGQVGFNLQLWSFLVLGVEGTFAGADLSDSANIEIDGERSRGHVDTDWIATIGGRLGFTFWKNRILAYAKGGAAFTSFDYHTEEIGGGENFNADEDRTVPFAGFGLEYALTCHWSLKVEYNHLFFDSENVTGTERTGGGSGVDRTFRTDPDFNTFQAGVNFRF
jgi:outer membrane immunogenic protein